MKGNQSQSAPVPFVAELHCKAASSKLGENAGLTINGVCVCGPKVQQDDCREPKLGKAGFCWGSPQQPADKLLRASEAC